MEDEKGILDLLPGIISDNEDLMGMITVLLPYLPALKRIGKEQVEIIIENILKENWPEVDAVLMAAMTEAELDQMAAESKRISFEAASASFKRNKLAMDVLVRAAIGMLIVVVL